MRRSAVLIAGVVGVFALLAPAVSLAAQQPVKVLVVTGGHDYEKEPFDAMFKAMDGVTVETAEHKETSEGFDKDLSKYDVVVLYDMAQKITDAQKKNLMKFLGEGKGLVSLHHNLGSYQDWAQYQKIIGGKFYIAERTEDDVKHAKSGWKHDVELKVKIEDKSHPIVQGMSDFEILDEAYNNFFVRPEVKPLLTTDNPASGKVVAWTHQCGKAPVAYIMFGHGASGYKNANYQKLVRNSIHWAAGRLATATAQKPAPAPRRGGG